MINIIKTGDNQYNCIIAGFNVHIEEQKRNFFMWEETLFGESGSYVEGKNIESAYRSALIKVKLEMKRRIKGYGDFIEYLDENSNYNIRIVNREAI